MLGMERNKMEWNGIKLIRMEYIRPFQLLYILDLDIEKVASKAFPI
jgi:hypothetical protein